MNRLLFHFILLLLGSVTLAGCCRRVDCAPCYAIGIAMSYRHPPGVLYTVAELQGTTIVTYDAEEDTVQDSSGYERFIEYTGFGQSIVLPPNPDSYWIITNDQLSLRDTVRLNMLVLDPGSPRSCCNCGPTIEGIEVTVNGEVFRDSRVGRVL